MPGVIYLKDTGIVRHLDELGRIVIPKEIRKKLRINNGDPVEIYTNSEFILVKKYNQLIFDKLPIMAFIKALKNKYSADIILCDNESIIYSTNELYKEGLALSESFLTKVKSMLNKDLPKHLDILLTSNISIKNNSYISRIFADYKECGYIIIVSDFISKNEIDLANIIKDFIYELLKFD